MTHPLPPPSPPPSLTHPLPPPLPPASPYYRHPKLSTPAAPAAPLPGRRQVGTFASHLSRLAYELMVARLGYFAPYSSVDYPWCFHMMHKDLVPGFGLVNC